MTITFYTSSGDSWFYSDVKMATINEDGSISFTSGLTNPEGRDTKVFAPNPYRIVIEKPLDS